MVPPSAGTKCLTSMKIAILTLHIIPSSLVNVWLIFHAETCTLYKLTMSIFLVLYWLKKCGFIASSNRQFEHAVLCLGFICHLAWGTQIRF